MKYQILVEKQSDNRYLAYSPVISNVRACGESLDSVLADIHQGFLCFLHDPDAEMEVIVRNEKQNADSIKTSESAYLI